MTTGRVSIDGNGVEGATVLLVSADGASVLAATTTSASGTYAFKVAPATNGPQPVVLAKVQQVFVAVAVAAAEPNLEFRLSSVEANRYPLLIRGLPADLSSPVRIFVNPVHLDDVPGRFDHLFLRHDLRVVDDAFYTFSWDGSPTELSVQSGVYRIGGTSLSKGGPIAGGAASGIAISAVTKQPGDEHLPGNASGGFIFRIAGPTRLAIELASVTPK